MVYQVLEDAFDKHAELGVGYADLRHKIKKGFSSTRKIVDRIEDKLETLATVTECIVCSIYEGDIPDIKANLKTFSTSTQS